MLLDFIPKTGAYVLRVARGEADPKALMLEHGLDFSSSASTPQHAFLFTREPYAAAVFADVATPLAAQQLLAITSEVALSRRNESNAHIKCPADKELWPFQRANVEYALRRNNTLIGDQPGLGKTPAAICFANEINAKRVLVICPANIRLQWCKFIREWSVMRHPYVVYPILHGGSGVNPIAEWTVVSYDLARSPEIGAALARGLYDLIVIDEAHYAKNINSQRTHALFGDHTGKMRRAIRDEEGTILDYEVLFDALASRCGSVMALTGTPLPNRPREAYVLARNLCFDSIDWLSEDSFIDRYNPSAVIEKVDKETGIIQRYTIEKAGRHGELQNRMRANFMTRHNKREVLTQLKMPVYDVILMEPNAAVRAALKAESMLDIDPEDERLFKQARDAFGGDIARVRHMMGIALAPLVAEHVHMLMDGGEEKLVIFGWHIEVLNILQRALHKYGVVRIDGNVSTVQRELRKSQFINDRNTKILIGNIQSIGTGTDGLQEVAWHLLFAECDWVPGNNQQAVDRLDRGGQKRTVQADFCVAPGSIGEKILSSSLRKVRETDKVLDRRGY